MIRHTPARQAVNEQSDLLSMTQTELREKIAIINKLSTQLAVAEHMIQ